VITPIAASRPPFDPIRDFDPIAILVTTGLAIVAHPSVPANTLAELIDYAKRNPGKLAYGSVGRGSAFHLIGESFKLATGIDMLHVPYTGANNANIIGDLLNNRIQVYFPAYPAVLSALPTGQVKLLAVFQTARVKQLPQLPTVNETLPNNKIVPSWFGFMGPAGLPQPIATRLQEEIRKALADPEVTSKLEEVGIIPVGSTSSEMAEAIRAGTDDMSKLVKELGIEPQ
jgi:tripartite-type tricarboxylate transporter receptor subunit TctC